MRGDNLDPQRRLIDVYHADAVDQANRLNRPALRYLVKEQINLMLSHALEDFVFESADVVVPLGLPHKPQEAKHCAHTTGKRPLLEQGGLINQLGRECQLPFHSVRELSTLHRSEERRVGKECRSRWSP